MGCGKQATVVEGSRRRSRHAPCGSDHESEDGKHGRVFRWLRGSRNPPSIGASAHTPSGAPRPLPSKAELLLGKRSRDTMSCPRSPRRIRRSPRARPGSRARRRPRASPSRLSRLVLRQTAAPPRPLPNLQPGSARGPVLETEGIGQGRPRCRLERTKIEHSWPAGNELSNARRVRLVGKSRRDERFLVVSAAGADVAMAGALASDERRIPRGDCGAKIKDTIVVSRACRRTCRRASSPSDRASNQ